MICRSDEDRGNPRAPFNQESIDPIDREFEVNIFQEDTHFAYGVSHLDRLIGEQLRPRNQWSYSTLDLEHDGRSSICDQDGHIVGLIEEIDA